MILRQGNPDRICIHHSAVKPGANNLEELKSRASSYNTTHSKKSWATTIKTPGEYGYPYIEYHYMIARDGAPLQVQDEKYVLYHAGDNFRGADSFNLHGIAVLLDGNYDTESPTDAQMKTVVELIRKFQLKYKVDAIVRGHKETSKSATACPGGKLGTHTSGWLRQVIVNTNDKNYPPVAPVKTDLELAQEEINRLKKNLGDVVAQNDVLRTEVETLKTRYSNLALDVEPLRAFKSKVTEVVRSAIEG